MTHKELISKAIEAKSTEKQLDLPKENSAELSDDELDNVSGGTGIIAQETESSTEPCYTGGILGYQDRQVTITDCSNTGKIANN